jgi:hypothetical protein
MACIETLREMVADERPRLLVWDDGGAQSVEARTAFDILAVHTLLKPSLRPDLVRKLSAGRLSFLALAGFCHSVLRSEGQDILQRHGDDA